MFVGVLDEPSSEAARLAAGKSKGKLVMAAAASPAQPHRGQPLILVKVSLTVSPCAE